MKSRNEHLNVMDELEQLDAFLSGEEPGQRPVDVVRERGIEVPDETALNDESLHQHLWSIIHEMAVLGMYLEDTDHLSDRELYRYLLTSALVEDTLLPASAGGAWMVSPIGGCSEEDIDVYLRYYADDDDRESFKADYGRPFPARAKPPFDRDRLLPQFEPPMESGVQ